MPTLAARNPQREYIRAFLRNRLSVLGLILVMTMVAGGILAPVLAPYEPNAIAMADKFQGPSTRHLMGTDQFGRDLFSRVLYGARVSLIVGLGATLVALVIGVTIGALAGFLGKWIDEIVMRVIDMVLAFPFIILAIGLIVVFGTSLWNLILVIGTLRVAQFARVARASVLSIREREFVLAARTLGQRQWLILAKHVFPNTLTPLVVLASISSATAINAEAALSFLGVGVQPPNASWGTIIADGRDYLRSAPWIATFPGLVISVTILGFNLLGDGLRDIFDPRSWAGRGKP
jgi:ABC-type dipeptide/oligopeptide/nickel transport system permease subunit